MFKCNICNFIHWGDKPFKKCPKCNAKEENFIKLDPEDELLLENARLTNDIYMKIMHYLKEINELSETGADINLDPGCFKIFSELLDMSYIKQQEIIAELSKHDEKGKLG